MWSGVLLTDDAAGRPVTASSVLVVPAGSPTAMLDALADLPPGPVVMAAPESLAGPLATAATVVAGRWPDLAVARLTSPHAPLAIFSALALAHSTTDHPAAAAGLVRTLLQHSWSGAWTPSVAKLTSPAPSLSQHVRSFLPGAGFLLRQAPQPAVLAGTGDAADVPTVPFDRVLLSQDGAVPSAIAQRFSAMPGVVAVRQVAVPGVWTSVYGVDRAGQLALVPAEPTRLLSSTPTGRCPSCALDLADTVCPFCRVVGVTVTPAGARP